MKHKVRNKEQRSSLDIVKYLRIVQARWFRGTVKKKPKQPKPKPNNPPPKSQQPDYFAGLFSKSLETQSPGRVARSSCEWCPRGRQPCSLHQPSSTGLAKQAGCRAGAPWPTADVPRGPCEPFSFLNHCSLSSPGHNTSKILWESFTALAECQVAGCA